MPTARVITMAGTMLATCRIRQEHGRHGQRMRTATKACLERKRHCQQAGAKSILYDCKYCAFDGRGAANGLQCVTPTHVT
jgi:hypothetical protein